jgi:hypothetical protein
MFSTVQYRRSLRDTPRLAPRNNTATPFVLGDSGLSFRAGI